jgi:hypothetical protein
MVRAFRALALVAVVIGVLVSATPAVAMPAAAPATPWAQPDGRVYAIARVGGVVYIGGDFTQVTDSDGVTVFARDHLAAVSAVDGHVLAWNPGANGSVRALAVSTDGRSIYIGGDFTSVGGKPRSMLAAEAAVTPTSGSTGTLLGWAPRPDNVVYALVPLDGRVYVGGNFLHVDGVGRSRLAAVDAVSGRLAAWQPRADGEVHALLVSPTGDRIFAGGSFQHLNGAAAQDIAAIDPATGRLWPWKSHPSGNVLGLAENSTTLFGGDSAGGGHVRAYSLATGQLEWTNTSDGNVVAVGVLGRGASQRVIAGGHFNNFGSYTRHKVAALDPATGLVDPDWSPYASGSILGVFSILAYGQHVYLGGDFLTWDHTGAGPVDQARLADFPSTDPPDTTSPTITTAPIVTIPIGTTVGSVAIPVLVRWAATDQGSGVCRYTVQRDYNARPYSAVPLRYATATSASTSITPSIAPYSFRANATDCSDNTSPYLAAPPVRLAGYQNSNRAIAYHGRWTYHRTPKAYGGSVKRSATGEASATLHFTGRDIAWIANLGPGYGAARIIVDGRTAATIHLHAASTQDRRIVYTKAWPTDGTHTIRIIALATPGHPLVDLDAFLTIK